MYVQELHVPAVFDHRRLQVPVPCPAQAVSRNVEFCISIRSDMYPEHARVCKFELKTVIFRLECKLLRKLLCTLHKLWLIFCWN